MEVREDRGTAALGDGLVLRVVLAGIFQLDLGNGEDIREWDAKFVGDFLKRVGRDRCHG